MKVIDKPLIVGGFQLGHYQAYTEIEDEFVATEPGTRVLPAQFFYEKRLFFHLKRRYEAGEHRSFPGGGFEVRDEGGAIRCYELDQVIIHPAVLHSKKVMDRMKRRAEKEQKKRGRKSKQPTVVIDGQTTIIERIKTGRKGRPSLSAAEKAEHDAAQAARKLASGGKRGRPKSTAIKVDLTPKVKSGKRGRPSLSAEALAIKAADILSRKQRSGGKRGRPKCL